jgi:hypothetical protein
MREHEDEREPAGRAGGKAKRARDPGDDWADQAARARTGDDPRAAAPHDTSGTPTTGSTSGRPEPH